MTSQNGPATTIIDCGGTTASNHRGFNLHSGETNAVISGLTIKNGLESTGVGGALDVSDVGTTIQNCIFSGNSANYGGGLVVITYGDTAPIRLP